MLGRPECSLYGLFMCFFCYLNRWLLSMTEVINLLLQQQTYFSQYDTLWTEISLRHWKQSTSSGYGKSSTNNKLLRCPDSFPTHITEKAVLSQFSHYTLEQMGYCSTSSGNKMSKSRNSKFSLFSFYCSCEAQNLIRILRKTVIDNLRENVDLEY